MTKRLLIGEFRVCPSNSDVNSESVPRTVELLTYDVRGVEMLRLLSRAIPVAIVVSALACALATGQTPSGAAVLGTGNFTAFVENMDRSLAFFHDVFGMEVPALPNTGERPYNRANPQLFAMFDIPGARERHQPARIP